jgi:ATP-grasp domain-containing protein
MKKIKILFPNEPFDRKNVDSEYADEFNACKIMGIDTYFYDYDEFVNENKFFTNIRKDDDCLLIYRGWMLKPGQYELLYNKILERTDGYVTLINSPEQYTNCHCFPNVYENIKGYTPIIIKTRNLEPGSISKLFLDIEFNFFIKDYVKSIKTDKGIEKLSKNIKYFDLSEKIKEFKKERGNLFTGGIVLKEFVNLEKVLYKGDSSENEWRAFYLYGKLVDISNNSNINTTLHSTIKGPPVEMVNKIGGILSEKSNFFTVDYAKKVNGQWIVLETGDGQVSGLSTDISSLGFYNKIWHGY